MTISYRAIGRCGRLGNALFELAATVGIALDHDEDVVFPADWIHRPFFSVPDELFGDVPPEARESTEFVTHLDPRALPYLQDINLFWPYIDLIRGYLKPSPLARQILTQNYHLHDLPPPPKLAVHVRRGDKVPGADPGVANNSDYHLCHSLDYYQRGVEEILGHPELEEENPWLCIFSDDVSWCRERFLDADYYGNGVGHPKEHEPKFSTTEPRDWIDLHVMAECDFFVLSGSTFGVWSAILADVPPDHVVRPDKIYGPIVSAYTDESLLFPPGWRICAA